MAQGHADAHIVLADLLSDHSRRIAFHDSDILFNNDDEAIRLLQLALEQGTAQRHLEGIQRIAELYVPHAFTQRIFVTSCRYHHRDDYAEAFNRYKLPYDAGSTASRVDLATMYDIVQT